MTFCQSQASVLLHWFQEMPEVEEIKRDANSTYYLYPSQCTCQHEWIANESIPLGFEHWTSHGLV